MLAAHKIVKYRKATSLNHLVLSLHGQIVWDVIAAPKLPLNYQCQLPIYLCALHLLTTSLVCPDLPCAHAHTSVSLECYQHLPSLHGHCACLVLPCCKHLLTAVLSVLLSFVRISPCTCSSAQRCTIAFQCALPTRMSNIMRCLLSAHGLPSLTTIAHSHILFPLLGGFCPNQHLNLAHDPAMPNVSPRLLNKRVTLGLVRADHHRLARLWAIFNETQTSPVRPRLGDSG